MIKFVNAFIFIVFLILSQPVFADLNLILDIDETLLMEVPSEFGSSNQVLSLNYQRGIKSKSDASAWQGNTPQTASPQQSEELQDVTEYFVMRPGIAEFLDHLIQIPDHHIYIASSNNSRRTQAIVDHLKIGKLTLAERGIQILPKSVFMTGKAQKNIAAIRTWIQLPTYSPLIAIDDHPEFYTGITHADTIIGITPWNFQNGITELISNKAAEIQITNQNTSELNQIWTNSIQSKILNASLNLSTDEIYSERPDIHHVNTMRHKDLPPSWKDQEKGILEAVAEIVEMYPDHQIYFLARDGELFYDFAKLALANEPQHLKRIHLLNVSRASVGDPNLLEYLKQEGISIESLEQGTQVLFVDTGYNGTIPIALYQKFPFQFRDQFHAQLMCSANKSIPPTRVLLESFQKGLDELPQINAHLSVLDYENMPHSTSRAHTYRFYQGRWEPTGTRESGLESSQQREVSKKYREDLKFFASTPEALEKWNRQREFWNSARKLLNQGETPALYEFLLSLLQSHHPLRRAMVRDFFEIVTQNEPSKFNVLPTLESLGLKRILESTPEKSLEEEAEAHPKIASILLNLKSELPKLVNGPAESLQTLQEILEIDQYVVKERLVNALLFQTDSLHQEASIQLIASIINRPPFADTFYKNFNKSNHSHPGFIEIALKAQNPIIRRKAALSLAHAQGDLEEVFQIALCDEDEEVRFEASSALRKRQKSF